MTRQQAWKVMVLLPLWGACPGGAAEPLPANEPYSSERVLFEARLASQPPLPFQAVRIRTTRRNVFQETVHVNAGVGPGFAWMKTPEKNFRYLRELAILAYIGGDVTRKAINLQPNDWVSGTSAGAAEWRDPGGGRSWRGEPLFPAPGTYVFGWTFTREIRPKEMQHTLEVTVSEPEGDDKEAFDIVAKDPYLASTMMSASRAADLETTEALESLLKQYPKSSYADYARFALARARVKGLGDRLNSTQEGVSKSIRDYLSRSDWSDETLESQLLVGLPCLPRERIKAMVKKAMAARDAPEERREAAIAQLAAVHAVSQADHDAAVKLLGDIKNKDFPYRPNALVLLAKLYGYAADRYKDKKTSMRWDEPERVKEITDELNRHYADSVEWVSEVSLTLRTVEQWRAFRVRKP